MQRIKIGCCQVRNELPVLQWSGKVSLRKLIYKLKITNDDKISHVKIEEEHFK